MRKELRISKRYFERPDILCLYLKPSCQILSKAFSVVKGREGVSLRVSDPKALEGFRKIGLFIPRPIRKIDEIPTNLKKQNKIVTE